MSKVLKIDRCRKECPFAIPSYNKDGTTTYWCQKAWRRIITTAGQAFPEWCPLEDAEAKP